MQPPASVAITEHDLTITELARRFSVALAEEDIWNSKGLSSNEFDARRLQYGLNQLRPARQLPEIVIFLQQFANFFTILLIVAAILSCVAWGIDREQSSNLYLGIILFVVVFLSCVNGYYHERKSRHVLSGFKALLAQHCLVIRDGTLTTIDNSMLVPGDLVKLQAGNKVPADLRLVAVHGLKVEASALTGESDPQQCTVEATHHVGHESLNMVFNSGLCLEGEALGVVVRTGDRSLIGQIASLTGSTPPPLSSYEKEIRRFVWIIAAIAFGTAAVFFTIGMLRGQNWIRTFVNGFILVLVANIPQGLPATVTSLLTLAAAQLKKQNVLVKRLQCVETLGSCTVIASDKTGTLTANKMHVQHAWFDNHVFTATQLVEKPGRAFKSEAFTALFRVAALCSRAKFDENDESIDVSGENADRKIIGDASEAALLRFVSQFRNMEEYQAQSPKIFEIPFNSTNKWQLSIHKLQLRIGEKFKSRRLLVMKGAPDILIKKCTHYIYKGEILPIDENFMDEYDVAYRQFGSYGERVLAMAELLLDHKKFKHSTDKDLCEKNIPMSGYTFVGLMSMLDPPRAGVCEAIADCHAAGIRVIMVTGDHPFTAEAIAKKVGIISEYSTARDIAEKDGIPVEEVPDERVEAVVVHGHNLANFTQADWDRVLSKHEVVFARTSPEQKLKIVENLQRLEEVVAVTGDGVNDSPALRKADIGVAMGICGSDVAKDAADVILMDDNFASIVTGIREGRIIFDNLKKTIAYTLSHLLPELIPVLLNLAGSFPLAIGSLLIICIDLGTELAPAISLAYESPEADIMQRPPRDSKKDRLVTGSLLVYSYLIAGAAETLCALLAYFMVYYWNEIPASSLPGTQGVMFLPPTNTSTIFITPAQRGFSPEEQYAIATEAQSAYFVTLVMCQVAHIWMCKTRHASLFTHGIANILMDFGVIIEVALVLIIVYVPFLNPILQSRAVAGQYWLPWLMGLGFLWAYNEWRKFCSRKWPTGRVARWLVW